MSFYANSFIYDSVPSETYDLGIFNFDTGKITSPMGSDIEIFKKQIYRKPVPYLFGTSQTPVLEFPILFGSFGNIDATKRGRISKWLFGQNSYKKLQIFQDDLNDIYFNCLLTNPEATYIGNLGYAIKATVVCDAPWAWEFPKTTSASFAGDNFVNYAFSYYNGSDNSDYEYPIMAVTLNGVGASFNFINVTDSNRTMAFDNLQVSETMTIDNYRQIISSSTGLLRMSNFNLKWFRLLPGVNSLNIQGQVRSFSITNQAARKVGG
jgi:phage-related protein